MPRILPFKDPEPEEINGFKDITEAVNFLDIIIQCDGQSINNKEHLIVSIDFMIGVDNNLFNFFQNLNFNNLGHFCIDDNTYDFYLKDQLLILEKKDFCFI